MMLTTSRKSLILYLMVLFGVLVLAFVIVTAVLSLHPPTSYECYASDPNKQLGSYRHTLDINVTAHTPCLTALNQASVVDTLRQRQFSSQTSLDQLTKYLVSNLTCTFRVHDTRKAGDTVNAIWTAHSLAVHAHCDIIALQTIYDGLTPQYRSLEASALASYPSASPVVVKRFVLSAQPDGALADVMYSYAGWDAEWRNFEESKRSAEKTKQDIRIAEREVAIVSDKEEEVRSLGTELRALEMAVLAGFPLDDAACDDCAGQNEGIVNKSALGAGQEENQKYQHHAHISPDDLQREQLKHWYWTHLASRAGIDMETFERQWWGQECVCVDAEKEKRVADPGR